jgi:hypothetical protein
MAFQGFLNHFNNPVNLLHSNYTNAFKLLETLASLRYTSSHY